jgi:hypothetical protein
MARNGSSVQSTAVVGQQWGCIPDGGASGVGGVGVKHGGGSCVGGNGHSWVGDEIWTEEFFVWLPMGSHEQNLMWKEVLACPS